MPEQEPAATAEVETPEQPVEAPETPNLGDAGQKALREERAARKAAEKAAKEARDELETIRQSQMSEHEKAIATARAEAKTEALAEANRRVLAAEVRASAAAKGLNPKLVAKLVDTTGIEVADDGSVDQDAIGAAIDSLLTEYPDLTPGPARLGSGDGGPRKTTTPTLQQQIEQAEAAGDFVTAGRLKAQLLVEPKRKE